MYKKGVFTINDTDKEKIDMISTVMDSIESHQFRRFRSGFYFEDFVMAYKHVCYE